VYNLLKRHEDFADSIAVYTFISPKQYAKQENHNYSQAHTKMYFNIGYL